MPYTLFSTASREIKRKKERQRDWTTLLCNLEVCFSAVSAIRCGTAIVICGRKRENGASPGGLLGDGVVEPLLWDWPNEPTNQRVSATDRQKPCGRRERVITFLLNDRMKTSNRDRAPGVLFRARGCIPHSSGHSPPLRPKRYRRGRSKALLISKSLRLLHVSICKDGSQILGQLTLALAALPLLATESVVDDSVLPFLQGWRSFVGVVSYLMMRGKKAMDIERTDHLSINRVVDEEPRNVDFARLTKTMNAGGMGSDQ